jgi:indolepyruvate ferredoxin oxidoreductase
VRVTATFGASRRPVDVFGYARHRREERQLAEEYAALMTTAIAQLADRPETYAAIADLARSVMTVQGYEDIKSAAIERWRADVAGRRAMVGIDS